MTAYNVERLRGPLGLFGKNVGQVSSGENLQVVVEPVWIELKLDNEVLTIRSVAAPVKAEFAADAIRRRPKVIAVIDHENPEIRTTRPFLSVRPKDKRSPRFVIWRTDLTNGEVLASFAADKFETVGDFYEALNWEAGQMKPQRK